MTLRPPVEPMPAQAAEAVPSGRAAGRSGYEQKLDGHQAILFTAPGPGRTVPLRPDAARQVAEHLTAAAPGHPWTGAKVRRRPQADRAGVQWRFAGEPGYAGRVTWVR
ncbi:hypothetical protein ABTX85_37505 [Streptomyces sp. NPDC096097]|uniref:hypothetical protein n=1 Tax=Streptomyces sp. NPDC096097 TaxID=3155546 RepID=UPI00331D1726